MVVLTNKDKGIALMCITYLPWKRQYLVLMGVENIHRETGWLREKAKKKT